ncbi:MAG: beta-ketoacyl synthase chain length factor [Desulfovibrionaceae bacterium]|nr:beta-ketoacyl synthase chain length factor [Desulfovibrionaceae bacterium]
MEKIGTLSASILGASFIVSLADNCKDSSLAMIKDGQTINADLASIFPKIALRRIPKSTRVALLSAAYALQNGESFPCDPKIGLTLAVPYASPQNSIDYMDSIIDNSPKLSSPTAFSYSVANMDAGIISQQLGFHGTCLTVSQFEFSFQAALTAAIICLHQGQAPQMLVGLSVAQESRLAKLFSSQNRYYPNYDAAIFMLLGLKGESNQVAVSIDSCPEVKEQRERSLSNDLGLESAKMLFAAATAKRNLDIPLIDYGSENLCTISFRP